MKIIETLVTLRLQSLIGPTDLSDPDVVEQLAAFVSKHCGEVVNTRWKTK